jgi:hypothetical protein
MSRQTITQILEEYIYNHQEPLISVNDLVNSIGDRGHGVLLLLLALPNVLLLASIPGLSTFFGIPIMLIGIQLIMKRPQPWLPNRVQHSQVQRETLLAILRKATPYLLRIEHFVKPRLSVMTTSKMEQVIGVFVLILGIIIALPIPFGNFLGGLGIVFFSLALMEKDGVFALIGMILTVFITFVILKILGSIITFLYNLL